MTNTSNVVIVSPTGTESHIPGTPKNTGTVRNAPIIKTNPRIIVTNIALFTRSTLWKYPIDIMFIANGIIPAANSGNPETEILYAASSEFINSDVMGALSTEVATKNSTPQITAVFNAILNAECTLGKYETP